MTMVQFRGNIQGTPFCREAMGPFHLIKQLVPNNPNRHKEFRMWIQIETKGGTFWCDVCLKGESEQFFAVALECCADPSHVPVVIRGVHENSPNKSQLTSPDPKKDKHSTPDKMLLPTTPVSLSASTSNLTESTAGLTLKASRSYQSYESLNVKDPFTQADISEADGLIPLYILNKKSHNYNVVLVDLESLEMFVQCEIQSKKNPLTDIFVSNVECRDNKTRNFQLTASVWLGSILEHSPTLRFLYSESQYAEKYREEQLTELKSLGNLFEKVKYWIADMFDFENAQTRLLSPITADNVPKLMSPFYFTEFEARYLGNVCWNPGSETALKTVLSTLAVGKNVCTRSHKLAPKLMRVFSIPKNFYKSEAFQLRRQKWLQAAPVVAGGKPKGL